MTSKSTPNCHGKYRGSLAWRAAWATFMRVSRPAVVRRVARSFLHAGFGVIPWLALFLRVLGDRGLGIAGEVAPGPRPVRPTSSAIKAAL
jgi:hypothetical protein